MNKRKVGSQKVILVASLLLGAVALFPPRQEISSIPKPAGRGFLFNPGFSEVIIPDAYGGRVKLYEINAGRLLAEALLIVALAGIALVYMWSEDA